MNVRGVEQPVVAGLYADDTVLFTESEGMLQRIVDEFDRVSKSRKMKVNAGRRLLSGNMWGPHSPRHERCGFESSALPPGIFQSPPSGFRLPINPDSRANRPSESRPSSGGQHEPRKDGATINPEI